MKTGKNKKKGNNSRELSNPQNWPKFTQKSKKDPPNPIKLAYALD